MLTWRTGVARVKVLNQGNQEVEEGPRKAVMTKGRQPIGTPNCICKEIQKDWAVTCSENAFLVVDNNVLISIIII